MMGPEQAHTVNKIPRGAGITPGSCSSEPEALAFSPWARVGVM